jgi:allantoicase
VSDAPELTDLTDLAAARFGGSVVATNDEFFAPASRMLLAEAPVARPGVYTDHGVWTDGWETRRRRHLPGSDWAIIRLGAPGVVRSVTVDTSHFTGNAPESVELSGAAFDGYPTPAELSAADVAWAPIVARTPVESDAVNVVPVVDGSAARVTHVRLVIHPDGGVARLRLHGEVVPDPRRFDRISVDLAAAELGGFVVACSDMHYGDRRSLNHPGDARVMGEGWETRRRRGPGHDWAVVRLAAAGRIAVAEIDTRHFKGNAPREVALWGRHAPDLPRTRDTAGEPGDWFALLGPTRLLPDTRHLFDLDVAAPDVTHVRVDAIPDGGLARLRLWGSPTPEGREVVGVRWLDALPRAAARRTLRACCASSAWVDAVDARRPFGDLATALGIADEEWGRLGPADWLEAFAAHPRIGERPAGGGAGAGGAAGGGAIEAVEQAAALSASREVAAKLAEGNRAYEERFGHVYLVRAAGRSAEEMLELLRTRLRNDPDTELRIAAAQQAEITSLRLHRLLAGP